MVTVHGKRDQNRQKMRSTRDVRTSTSIPNYYHTKQLANS